MACPAQTPLGALHPQTQAPFLSGEERNGGKKVAGVSPLDPLFAPAFNKAALAMLALFLIKMRCAFAHNIVQGKHPVKYFCFTGCFPLKIATLLRPVFHYPGLLP